MHSKELAALGALGALGALEGVRQDTPERLGAPPDPGCPAGI